MPAEPRTLALWPLPLAAALLPLVATVTAFQLSVHLGLIPPCNPLLEGCVSISRAARHESPNVAFRILVARALVAACAALPLLGIVYAMLAQALEAPARDALENVAEWWAGLAFTLYFVALAWAWRATRFALKLEVLR